MRCIVLASGCMEPWLSRNWYVGMFVAVYSRLVALAACEVVRLSCLAHIAMFPAVISLTGHLQ